MRGPGVFVLRAADGVSLGVSTALRVADEGISTVSPRLPVRLPLDNPWKVDAIAARGDERTFFFVAPRALRKKLEDVAV